MILPQRPRRVIATKKITSMMRSKPKGAAGPTLSKSYPPTIVNIRIPNMAKNQNSPSIVPLMSAGIPLKKSVSTLMFINIDTQTYRQHITTDYGSLGSLICKKQYPMAHLNANVVGMRQIPGILSAHRP